MTAHGRLLPYGRQSIEEDDITEVNAVLRSPWLTTGPMVDRFEQAFAAKVGADHAVACSSGTAALHLACLALGLGPGDGVVVPTLTFAATANCARFVGAEVVFADIWRTRSRGRGRRGSGSRRFARSISTVRRPTAKGWRRSPPGRACGCSRTAATPSAPRTGRRRGSGTGSEAAGTASSRCSRCTR
jgi:hypothetical protein